MNPRLIIIYFTSICLLFPTGIFAQFIRAEVGVDGLTCSQCTRSVEMSIRRLSFVENVKMNLDSTNGIIFLKKDSKIEIEKIAKAVYDAGFSVRYLKAVFIFNNVQVDDNSIAHAGDINFYFLKSPSKILDGKINLTFIGPKFMAKKDFSEWKTQIDKKTAVKDKVYFVIA